MPQLRFDRGLVAFDFQPSLGIVAKRFDKYERSIRSFREPLLRSVREVMIPSIGLNFQSSGRPPWEPLSLATEQMRERAGYDPGPPLIRSGKLQKVMRQINIWTITSNSASIRKLPDRVGYGGIHQAGAGSAGREPTHAESVKIARAVKLNRARREEGLPGLDIPTPGINPSNANIPARPFVVLQDEDAEKIERVFRDWVTERLVRAGI